MTQAEVNQERHRRRAAALAAALAPLMDSLDDAAPAPPAPPAAGPNVAPLLAKAWAVSDALMRLENDRYTRGEIAARRGLERAAKDLRATLKLYWRGRT